MKNFIKKNVTKSIHIIVLLLCTTVVVHAQKKEKKFTTYPDSIAPVGIVKNISDSALLDIVQRQTFRYFWHYAHPISGLSRERDNTVKGQYYWDWIDEAYDQPNISDHTFGYDDCAMAGTGMGIMATIVAVNRKWIGRDTAAKRLVQMVNFLTLADSYHGIFPHFINGTTGKPVAFGRLDDGADVLETAYLLMGFLCAREYFDADNPTEKYLRKRITQFWETANFKWHTAGGNEKLYWHWSPNNDFDMNFPIKGWNEGLITYVLAASSPYHSIEPAVYFNGFVNSTNYRNNKTYYGMKLPLGFEYGGPLFISQYSFLGIDPHGLTDWHTNYMEQNTNHTLINGAYCIENPKKYKGYGANCWGLTAGDSYKGYVAHCPEDDFGVIQPTAALSAFPYTPEHSMQALKHFYYDLGDKIWSDYGFVDGFGEQKNWYAKTHLAIDQGPIVVMIENYRTGLLWNLFMKIPDIQNGLKKLGFKSKWIKE
jgi:hypothetical protein